MGAGGAVTTTQVPNGTTPVPPSKRVQAQVDEAKPDMHRQVDWDGHFSAEGEKRVLPSLRVIISQFQGQPGIIGLHGGLPAGSAFPITSLSFTLRDGTTATVDDPVKLEAMQQYSVAPLGYGPLASWAEAHTRALHSPPAQVPLKTTITGGANQALEFVISLLMNEGDSVLVEKYTYSHLVDNVINFRGYKAVPIETDADGMVPSSLRETLESMHHSAHQATSSRPPRVLYTVPTGQNPTGLTVPLERKRELYAICAEYDIVIIEDDPYYYLQFGVRSGEVPGLGSGLEPSYLSIDTDARVVRLDSFAKFLAPGLRLGWVTAAAPLVEKLTYCIHGSSLGACATTQVLVQGMLDAWGPDGLEQHTRTMQKAYSHRAQVVVAAAEEHLKGLAQWNAPSAGMFLWIRLLAGVTDADQIFELLKDARVVVVPGRICHALGPTPPEPCPFVRVSFSSASDEDLTQGITRLGTVLRSFAQLKDVATAVGHPENA